MQSFIREFKMSRWRREREREWEREISYRLTRAAHLLLHYTTTTTNCLVFRFMENVNKWRRILFPYVNMDIFLRNSTPWGFAYKWHSGRAGIIALSEASKNVKSLFKDVFAVVGHRCRLGVLNSLLCYVGRKWAAIAVLEISMAVMESGNQG